MESEIVTRFRKFAESVGIPVNDASSLLQLRDDVMTWMLEARTEAHLHIMVTSEEPSLPRNPGGLRYYCSCSWYRGGKAVDVSDYGPTRDEAMLSVAEQMAANVARFIG